MTSAPPRGDAPAAAGTARGRRLRALGLNLGLSAASVLVVLLVGELAVRTMAFSNGGGGGRAARRWDRSHWKPINRHGYRDVEWSAAEGAPAVVFLGDSFTEGHGVEFTETFYYRTRAALEGRYTAFNLGKSGASTRMEEANYHAFRKESGVRPVAVVLQYFGNDMADLMPRPPEWRPWPGLSILSRHSELAELASIYMEEVRWGGRYADYYLSAYDDPALLARHRADLARLFDLVHGDGARVLFVVFPYLDNEDYLLKSRTAYVDKVKAVFRSRCRPGDLFIDTTPVALQVPRAARSVNRLDGHPSPRLHARVAVLLSAALLKAQASSAGEDGMDACPVR